MKYRTLKRLILLALGILVVIGVDTYNHLIL